MGQNIILAISLTIFSAHVILAEEFICPRSRGYYPHPTECNKYYSCRKRISTLKLCPERMLFDVNKGNCYINSAVDCSNRKKPTVIVVTMAEIQKDTTRTTEVNLNTNIHTRTATNTLSTSKRYSSMLPVKDSTSDMITAILSTTTSPADNGLSESTIETDTTNHHSTRMSDTEPGISESMLDDLSSIVSDTSVISTDAEQDELYTTTNNLDYNTETFSGSPSTNKENDENVTNTSEINVTIIASTEQDQATSEEYKKPERTEPELDKTSIVVTDRLDLSTSRIEIAETSKSVLDYSTTAVSSSSDLNTDRTSIEGDRTSDIKDASIVVSFQSEPTTKQVDDEPGSSVSYFQNVSMSVSSEPDLTTNKGSEDSGYSTHDLGDGDTITNWPDLTTYERDEISISKLDEISTMISNDMDFSHEEHNTTVTEFFDSRSTVSHGSNSIPSNWLSTTSDGFDEDTLTSKETETNVTSSHKETTNSTSDTNDVSELNNATMIASTEPASHLSSKIATTEESIIITDEPYPDDYYLDDFDCPTAYGRYPHPTDKHKFLHCQEWFPHIMICPADLVFDPKLEICIWSRRS